MNGQRKLAAIMFTDMVGYTALMQEDEQKARELVQQHREMMVPLVEKHSGTVIQYVGDGTFSTFGSAIEAINCAIEIQRNLLDNKEISLRIGIHVGDVVVDGDEVYGDGVNVASRLEPLAEPGGICISERIYEDIKNKPDMEAEFLGEKTLKNVDLPVKVYVLTGEGLSVPDISIEEEKPPGLSDKAEEPLAAKRTFRKVLPWAVGAAVVIILSFTKGWLSWESQVPEVAAEENSLAIMFIENISDPADGERYAEMIRELLITDLSQSQAIRVIGSQRLYDVAKRKRRGDERVIDRSNASEVAREAGARWMLLGALSKIGSRMVLTTQVEEVSSGKVMDAQRADGEDLFAIVDRLTEEIRADFGVTETPGEIDVAVREITTTSTEAYRRYLEGLEFLNESNFGEAMEKLQTALDIDSTFVQALYKLTIATWWYHAPGDDRKARRVLEKLLAQKEGLPEGERLLIDALTAEINDEHSKAQEIYEQLLKTHPDEKEVHYGLGEAYFHGGGAGLKSLEAFESVLRLDPEFNLAYRHIFDIYFNEGMFERGIEQANKYINLYPEEPLGYYYLGYMYLGSGEFKLAVEYVERAIGLDRKEGMYKSALSYTYLCMGNYGEAVRIANGLLIPEIPLGFQRFAKLLLAWIYTEQGQIRTAIGEMEGARRMDRTVGVDAEATTLSRQAIQYSIISDTTAAFALMDSMLALRPTGDAVISSSILSRAMYTKGRIFAQLGMLEELEAIVDDFRQMAEGEEALPRDKRRYKALLFLRDYHRGDLDGALVEYADLDERIYNRDAYLYQKGMIYLKKKDYDKALAITRDMQAPNINYYSRSFNYPRAYYLRGLIYEEMGETSLAIENYRALLDLWKGADEEIPERRDAIKRLAALKQGS